MGALLRRVAPVAAPALFLGWLTIAGCGDRSGLLTDSSEGGAPGDAATGAVDTGSQGGSDAARVHPSGFCASLSPKPLFCDDFDDAPFPSLWTSHRSDPGGDAGVDDATAVSAPNSAIFTVEPNPPPQSIMVSASGVARQFNPVSFTLFEQASFDVLLSVGQAEGLAGLANFFTINSGNCPMAVGPSSDGGLVLYEGNFINAGLTAPASIPPGQWTHVDLEVNLATRVATVSVNGSPVLAAPPDPLCIGTIEEVSFSIGATCADPCPTGASVRFDNFVFDAK